MKGRAEGRAEGGAEDGAEGRDEGQGEYGSPYDRCWSPQVRYTHDVRFVNDQVGENLPHPPGIDPSVWKLDNKPEPKVRGDRERDGFKPLCCHRTDQTSAEMEHRAFINSEGTL